MRRLVRSHVGSQSPVSLLAGGLGRSRSAIELRFSITPPNPARFGYSVPHALQVTCTVSPRLSTDSWRVSCRRSTGGGMRPDCRDPDEKRGADATTRGIRSPARSRAHSHSSARASHSAGRERTAHRQTHDWARPSPTDEGSRCNDARTSFSAARKSRASSSVSASPIVATWKTLPSSSPFPP